MDAVKLRMAADWPRPGSRVLVLVENPDGVLSLMRADYGHGEAGLLYRAPDMGLPIVGLIRGWLPCEATADLAAIRPVYRD